MKKNSMMILVLAAVFSLASLSGCGILQQRPVVLMRTEFGDIKAELYTDKAPVTAGNFLQYVKDGRFKDAVFYRVVRMDNQPNDKVKIQVLQGGLYDDNHTAKLPMIRHETTKETGVKHKNGMLSMARWGPGTADSEFSICVGDQPELDFAGKRNPDGQGFAAFGRVIKGMDVVRKIHAQNAEGQTLRPFIKIEKMTLVGQ